MTLVLIAVNGLGSRLLPAIENGGQAAEPPSGSFPGLVAMVMLLQTVPLTYAIVRSKWSGWRLTAAVWWLKGGEAVRP